jgi:hypothetical protein
MLHIDWQHAILVLLIGDRPFVDTTSPTDPDKCYNAGYSKHEKDVSFPFIAMFQPMLEG